MRDFTLHVYEAILETARNSGYVLESYEAFIDRGQTGKSYILRHDVDARPLQSLRTAKIEASLNVRGTYYFRAVPQSHVPVIVREIASLGHEIGYHYEDLAHAHGNFEKAYDQFCKNLELFRTYYPVRTICMHGSPLSRWDNRKLWERYDYRKSGIIAEPYFDTDFRKVFYLTDTGRKWNEIKSSIRDKVESGFDIHIASSFDLIKKLNSGTLPQQIMQNIHPQRWIDDHLLWTQEFVIQNLKNIAKRFIAGRNRKADLPV